MNKNIKNCTKLALAFLLIAPLRSPAQQNSLKGVIYTKDSLPARDVEIIVNDSISTNTERKGEFNFIDLSGEKINKIEFKTEGKLVLTKKYTNGINEGELNNFYLPLTLAQLKEVIVSSYRRNLPLSTEDLGKMPMKNLENPQVYSVVPHQLMIEQNVTNLQDALRNVTGAAVSVDPAGGTHITSRGFSTPIGARNGMPYLGVGRSGLDPANVETIEVLKGPSGTLFGNAITSYGGLVNLVTKKPFDVVKSEVSYTFGSYGLQRVTADVNAPLNKEKTVLFRANAAVNKQGSFMIAGHNNRLFFAPSITFQATDRLKLSLDVEMYREDVTKTQYISSSGPLTINSIKDYPIQYNQTFFDNSFNAIANNFRTFAKAEYKLSDDWTSTTNVSFNNEDLNKSLQGYLYFKGSDSVTIQGGDFGPINTNTSDFQQNFNGDVRFLGMRHRILFGIDYFNYVSKRYSRGTPVLGTINYLTSSRLFSQQDVTNAYGTANVATTNSNSVNNRLASYVSDLINITKGLMILGSVRYDRYMAKNPGGYNQNSWTPRFGIVYQPILDVVSIFGNYTSGFTNYNTGIQPDGSTFYYKPSFANQWETGVKVDLLKNRLISTISYYSIKINDAPRTGTDGTLYQDGQQKSNGWEFDLKANPINELSITAGYVYNKNIYLRSTSTSGYLNSGSPKNIANLWVSYRFAKIQSLEHFGMGAGMNFVDKSFMDVNNTILLPSYTLFNASVFYDANNWRLGIAVNNISNQKYWNSIGTAQMPRNISCNVAFKF
ncbi:TonB-dependent siderophore receptor [Rhizosphaericola mali]|uniref:TonB-dependent siderophore receptor n=1 Tax=Rhizosphaericola mali TaxID=2545455 RepID=A0A5P2G6H2_9BACT|nr:TonB-dependent siderophore receptor [Rhizosphaericola mali]QES90308.1 TonB-dependent siderophore receptor [Rhizosphaericola mali]